jgi:hypothetical protein
MRAPKALQDEGKRLWRSVTAVFDLADDPHKLQILAQACRVADVISELDEAAGQPPLSVKGSMGQQVISPFIAEARAQRSLMAQLIARLNFEGPQDH